MTTNSLSTSSDHIETPQALDGVGPAARYPHPREILTDSSLAPEEKLRLLEEWEEDIRLALVAAEEGMTGADDVQLREVLSAKRLLTPDAARPDTPSKS